MLACAVCGAELQGRQRKFCSRACKNRSTNTRLQTYEAQQRRGRLRKLKLLEIMGMVCSRCGYDRNCAALVFDHRNPKRKSFSLDLRSLSNRKWSAVLAEVKKCDLVCSNCHHEIHSPDFDTHSLKDELLSIPDAIVT